MSVPYGGGCINDTLIHLATSEMGFGGTGESGMGAYHGKTGFDTFSHYKSNVSLILRKKRLILILHKLPLYFFEKILYNEIGFLLGRH